MTVPTPDRSATYPRFGTSSVSERPEDCGWTTPGAFPESPFTGEPRLRLVSLLRDLHDVYRPHASESCGACGTKVIPKSPLHIRRQRGRARFTGLWYCGLRWECPTCGAFIKARRALEVETARVWHVQRYSEGTVFLLTLTVAHLARHDLREVRRGVAAAWRFFQQGRGWTELAEEVGLVGTIRALEVTHGPNGWHPHLHVVLFLRTPVKPDERNPWGVVTARADWTHRVRDRWQNSVRRALGHQHVPDESHGVDLTLCDRDARYLAKLGLEVSAPHTKTARNGNRTPLEILADCGATGDVADLRLYQAYAAAMKGARQLTWSRGLKKAAGITDREDAELVHADDPTEEVIASVSYDEFAVLRQVPGAITTLLELADVHGARAVYVFLRELTAEWSDEARRLELKQGLGARAATWGIA